jgi:hypothetical protein
MLPKIKIKFCQKFLDLLSLFLFFPNILRIQVRRTDKGQEADFLPLNKYLQKADELFKLHEEIQSNNKKFERTIFLMTDDEDVINEALAK